MARLGRLKGLSCLGGSSPDKKAGAATLGATASSAAFHAGSSSSSSSSAASGHQHPAALALQQGRLSVSFSGGGFLIPYLVGVAGILRSAGLLRAETHVGGSSSGSLMAASIASGLTEEQLMEHFMASVRDCRENGVFRRLGGVVHRSLLNSLPADAHTRCSTGATSVCVTRVLFPGRLRPRMVSHFESREDLISTLLASCHIPRISDGSLTTSWRGKVVLDGGITALIPEPHAHTQALLAPSGASSSSGAAPPFLLKVCAFPPSYTALLPVLNRKQVLAGLQQGIWPGCSAPTAAWPYSLKQMVAWALEPGPDAFIQELLTAGRADALHWVTAAGVAPTPAALARAPALQLPLPLAPATGVVAAPLAGGGDVAAVAGMAALQAHEVTA